MIVAIVSAVRTSWKDEGNDKDAYYFWRNAMSNIWYSSEIAGTIIVQCIPILRPLIRDIHTSLTSKRLASTTDARSTARRSKGDPFLNITYTADCWAGRNTLGDSKDVEGIELGKVSEVVLTRTEKD